jgi:hypothetical protein
MATDKDIGFKIEVEGVEQSINSIKDLKKAIKDATDEQIKASEKFGVGSKEYQKASQRVSELKDKVDDLKDSTKSLQGSGIERASAGFSQLGEGLKNLDFDKVKVGFAAMKTAIAAVGIGLIIQLVQYLIENFDRLSQGSNGVAKALRFVGDIIGEILKVGEQMLNFLTDAIGLTSELERQQEAMGKAAIDSFTKSKEALVEQTAEMDRNIKVAKAMGKNTVEMEIEKQQAIIETNKQYLLQLEQMAKTRAITDEERKLIKESAKAIKDAKAEIKIIEANAQKEKDATTKTNNATAEANRQKQLADEKKLFSDIQRERLASMADRDKAAYMQLELDKQKAIEEIEATKASEAVKQQARYSAYQEYVLKVEALDKQIADKKLADEEKAKADAEAKRLADAEKEKQTTALLVAEKKKKDEEALAKEKAVEDARFQIAQNSINSLQGLSDMYFLFKTKNLEKGSAEELRQAKRQFDINKGLQIASATIAGIQGVQNALSATSILPEPMATAFRISNAIAVGVASAANIAKIAASQFSVGGGATGGGGTAPAPQPIPAPPTVSNPNANIEGSKFDEQGNKISNGSTMPAIQVNATVGVDEISAKTNRINVLEKQSTF